MTLANTSRSYGSVTKSFHWLTALLIFTVIPLGLVANSLAEAIVNPDIPTTDAQVARAALLFSMHKTIGVTIFFVALARIIWTLTQPHPGLLNADNKPEAFAAETVHWLLYGSLVLVPLSGWIHHAATTGFAPIWWPFGQTLPFVPKSEGVAALFGGLHWILQWVLIGALVLHIAGAVKHHIIDHDQTLRRMLPGANTAPEPPEQHRSALPPLAALVAWGAAIAGGAMIGAFGHGEDHNADRAALAEVQSDWQVENGTLGISVTQLGSMVDGSFADWTAAITFDAPDAPGKAGDVEVVVSIPSLTLGSVTSQALGPDFFDAAQFPTASFTAEIHKTETGYEARGPLTIRDQSVDVVLPFDLKLDGDTAEMSGSLLLDRLDFGVGQSLPDESSVAFGVAVDVSLTAKRGDD
ncbi:cytochrome b/b6 domain-containing protein [Ruegeria sp. 2012CJ41-6]|uniref:Cytochrome b/b6 domain-containing protein n=1 Tax=Ruegeria spongiae TaxID=2942209 RepID=A0ABT0Q0J3_9RHOB|nr:cytochrome b/b6 domain-containing protein [Ruegeria spongiae]MCL6283122.1 cytochrome b/b6 domain-containing protein [Ruegeria spongiae]